MNNEKEIERMEYEIFSHTDFHGREYEAKHISQALINAGIGDKKQAVKEFAEKLKELCNKRRKLFKALCDHCTSRETKLAV